MRKEKKTDHLALTRFRLEGAFTHLAGLRAGIERTFGTIERARKAHAESIDLLARIDSLPDGKSDKVNHHRHVPRRR